MLKWIFGLSLLSQAVIAGPMNDILTAQYLKKKKSFIYSPLSLDVALSMTAEGSAGDTRKQFQKILALPNFEIYKKLNVKHAEYDFVSAQKVWVQQDYPIQVAFEKTLKEDYQSILEKADFKTKSKETIPVINKWVEEKTKEKIKDLIPENGLTPLTRFVLVNAVYFKAKWLSEFDANATSDEDFKIDKTTKTKVPMMFKKFEKDLKASGLTLAFDKEKADFSLMSPLVKTSKEENLYISKIFHKAFVEVGEKGTEAAAASAVVMAAMGAAMPVEKPKVFKADHPFIYFIKQKDQILFSGYFAGNK